MPDQPTRQGSRGERRSATYSDGATFGQVVRRVREGRNMTMDDLAAAAKMSKASISTIEADQTDPRVSTVFRLAEALRLPWWSLLGHACGQRKLEDDA